MSVKLGRIYAPLIAAHDYVVLSQHSSNEEERAYYQKRLIQCLEDAAGHAGFDLVPRKAEQEIAA